MISPGAFGWLPMFSEQMLSQSCPVPEMAIRALVVLHWVFQVEETFQLRFQPRTLGMELLATAAALRVWVFISIAIWFP